MKIEKTVFDGLEGYLLETSAVRMIVITEVGPRIAWYSKQGEENLLYWHKDGIVRDDWKLYGGHRVWISRPMADESEDTYQTDNDPCKVTLYVDGLTAETPKTATGLVRGMEIHIIDENKIQVRNYLRNDGSMLYSGGCWSPTCVVADKPIEIPLGAKEENPTWDVVYIAIPRVFAGNVTAMDDDSVTMQGNTMVLTPKGRCVKRCLRAEQGTIRLRCNGYVFQKTSPFCEHYAYQMNGCNIAAFIATDNVMAEMETYGAEQTIKPGQTIDNVEQWAMIV